MKIKWVEFRNGKFPLCPVCKHAMALGDLYVCLKCGYVHNPHKKPNPKALEGKYLVLSSDGKRYYAVDLKTSKCECKAGEHGNQNCRHIRLARDPTSIATVFKVQEFDDHDNDAEVIDLEEE